MAVGSTVSGHVRYTKWQWALSCVTKNATMYRHYETMNDGISLGISNITHSFEAKDWNALSPTVAQHLALPGFRQSMYLY